MSCSKCDKPAYVNYKDKNYCTWYCAKKGQDMTIHEETDYVYGVHCGDANCYSCTTMKGECSWLDSKDKLEDEKNETK